MKKTFCLLTFFFFYSTALLAEDATKASEEALNKTLLDNAAKSKEILNASQKNAPTTIKILSNKGSSSASSLNNLTDQEKQLSENYVDQAAANRIIQEKCQGSMAQACSGNEVDHKVMGMSPTMIKAAAQAYAAFGTLSDSFLPLSRPVVKPTGKSAEETAKPEATKNDSANERPTDYCKYIPAATEAIALFTQQNTVQNLSNGGETSQKEILLKAAKSHDGRAQQAQIQAAGWFGGAACYAINASPPLEKFAWNTSLIVKLGAATLLGTFYQMEVSANKEYAEKTRQIAYSLPGKGYCNPITENECYCSEPEHENDPQYCQAQIAKRNSPSSFTRIACTDNKMQIDPSCVCDKSNTCFDKFLENQGAADIQMGLGYSNSPFKSITSIAHGKLEGGTLNSTAYAGMSAIAKKALSEASTKVQESPNLLTADQKSVADAIASKGIPSQVAQLMAQNAPPQNAIDKAMAKAQALGSSYKLANYSPGRNNVLDFSGGNGLGINGKKIEKKNGMEDLLGKLNPKASPPPAGKILEFAQKAQAQVPQITKSDKALFEIISSRYQSSGRRLLQLDSNN